MARTQFPPAERAVRSKVAKLIHEEPLMRGTLSVRRLTCGKPSCRCHAGQKHVALYLSYGKEGRVHQAFVPREAEAQVRAWVRNYAAVRVGLEQVSQMYRERLAAQKSRRRARPSSDG
jgi:hypothetical protein